MLAFKIEIMAKITWLFFATLVNLYVCDGYNLLVIFPIPSKSHGILGDNFVKHLLDAGHEVTYITPYNKKEVHPNLKIVDVSENMKFFNADTGLNVKQILDKELNLQTPDVMTNLLIDIATATLKTEKLQKFLRDPKQKFDAVISEWMFTEIYSTFAYLYNCPLIWFSTLEPHWIILNLVDGPVNPAYSSDYLEKYVPPLTFIERVNTMWTLVDGLFRKNFNFYYKEEALYQRFIVPILKQKNRLIPSYETLRYNSSLLLGNTQVVTGDVFSLPQSYKHIGGYHIDEEVKPLPEDLKRIMDNSKHGVIYFSMGSNLKSKDFPIKLKRGILEVFASLKQTVIWKFEEVLPDMPKNVHILQWAPQQSILAHPNTVLFITHGGQLSITETVHFGVPVISIPVFADQFLNSVRAEKKGYGKKVDLSYNMHEDIKVAINEILGNPKYAAKAKELSRAYHDVPMKPKDELTYWVEHVIRTGGAPHLRSPALQLYLYERIYLDVIVVILIIIIFIVTIAKWFISKAFGKRNNKEKRS